MLKFFLLIIVISIVCTSGADGAPEKGPKSEDIRLKAPWAAAIFKKTGPGPNDWEFLCSGTITSRYTVLTSARCVIPRVIGKNKLSPRLYHHSYSDLQVVVGLPTTDYASRDKHSQIGIVGQIRDAYDMHRSGDTPERDLAALRLKNQLDLSTPYVKSVQLLEVPGSLLEVNETKAGEVLILSGYEKEKGGVTTRSQAANGKGSPLKTFEIVVEDLGTCIDQYTKSYQAFYFNVFCGKMQKKSDTIPCHYEGSGLVKKVIDIDGKTETFYLFGIYSSNSALAKTEGLQADKNMLIPPPCAVSDLIFFSKYGHLGRWGISNNFCDNELATCDNDRCRPWQDLCNGRRDCEDGSDETEKACFNQIKKCEKDKFKCAYGVCIDNKLRCDSIEDCIDGSDEDKETCKNIQSQATVTNRTTPKCEAIKMQQSVTAHCSHSDRPGLIPCDKPVPIGTTAVLRNSEVVVTCGKDAKWTRSTRLSC